MTDDAFSPRFRGHVRQFVNGELARSQPNLVVDASMELTLRALMGRDFINRVQFANSNGRPATPGQRTIVNPVGIVSTGGVQELQPFISQDSDGRRTIGTWSAVWGAPANVQYDTLGLISQASLLFAATTFDLVSLTAGDTVAVQWTIYLRGN